MKKYIISVAMCLSLGFQAFSQTAYLEEISFANSKVEKTAGRMVRVDMDIDLGGLDIKKQHSLQIVPVIVSADGSCRQALPPLFVDGKVRHKVNLRRAKLQKEDFHPGAMATVGRNGGKVQVVPYEAEVPFKRWMIGGRLLIEGKVEGCALCNEGNETAYMGDVFPPMAPVYSAPFIIPKEEVVKRRSETRAARLQFGQGSHVILPGYKDNGAEISKVRESLELVKENPNLSITGIYVTGYASPEGSMDYNLKLSERRAKAFTEHIKKYIKGIDASLYHVDWKGEDWDELRRQVELHPELEGQDEVLRLIDGCDGDKDGCEKLIRKTVAADTYRIMLEDVYGPVRRNEYRIEYNVRHFDIEEGRQMIKTRPDLMSVSEIQKVADSYGRGSAEYVDCLLRGVKAYPENVTAVNNAALALMEAGRHAEAVAILEAAPADAVLQNMLGVAYLKMGNTGKAGVAFGKAMENGCEAARKNKQAMDAYTEYMAE